MGLFGLSVYIRKEEITPLVKTLIRECKNFGIIEERLRARIRQLEMDVEDQQDLLNTLIQSKTERKEDGNDSD